MSGLVIKLAPKERILINGAVIENGDRRARRQAIGWAAAFVALIVAVSAFFYPIWTAWVIPYDFWRMHMWLTSWI